MAIHLRVCVPEKAGWSIDRHVEDFGRTLEQRTGLNSLVYMHLSC